MNQSPEIYQKGGSSGRDSNELASWFLTPI